MQYCYHAQDKLSAAFKEGHLLHGIKNKENMLVKGDRSHPNLVLALDHGLRPSHIQIGKKTLLQQKRLIKKDGCILMPFFKKSRYEMLKERERAFLGDRSHPRLVKLDALELSYYPGGGGWEADLVEKAATSRASTASRGADYCSCRKKKLARPQ